MNRNQHITIRERSLIILGGIFLLNACLGGRLIYIQGYKHRYFLHKADEYRVSKSILPARRGLILDRDGYPFAINVPAWAIFADPLQIKDLHGVCSALAPILGLDPDQLAEKLICRNNHDHYRDIMRRVSDAEGLQVKALNLLGIGVIPDSRRGYPDGLLACHVLGFTDKDGHGIEGIEHSQDALLSGHDGRVIGEIDAQGRFLPGTIRNQTEPENGSDLVLTIDRRLQYAADTRLAQAVKEHHARNGVVVVLDPQTGEILALSSAPSYNPNCPRPPGKLSQAAALALAASWRDSAVSDLYEPGSTMKSMTASAVLQDEGLRMMEKHVYCNGHMQIGNHVIHCAQDPPYFGVHGDETLRGVLKESCNIGMAQFGIGLGAQQLYAMEKQFGFLDNPGSGLPGEQHSWLQNPSLFNKFTGKVGWSDIQLANVSFGQGVSVTPLQLAAAYCAIANGGTLIRPHIIHAIRHDGHEQVIAPETIRRVLDPPVAAMVRSLLGTVVQDGTGKPAQIAGYTVGGKTGSAQVAGPHGYENGHYVASFVGMIPLSHPRLVILCAVFEPQGVHWGAAVAAPVVHDIAEQAMMQMHIAPDDLNIVDWDDHLKPLAAYRHRINALYQ